jgi:hypothetical protein
VCNGLTPSYMVVFALVLDPVFELANYPLEQLPIIREPRPLRKRLPRPLAVSK